MIQSKIQHLTVLAAGNLQRVEQLAVEAALEHGDHSAALQSQVLDVFAAVDALHAQQPHGSDLFTGNAKLQSGYPAMRALAPEKFWPMGLSKLKAYRDTLWDSQEAHAQ